MARGIADYFGRTYIINLPQRSDRRRQTVRELSRADVALQPGRVEFFSAIRPDEAAGFPSIGVHGCFLSHLEVLRQAAQQNLRSVLVLEDDVTFVPGFAEAQQSILELLEGREWDFFYMGHRLEAPPMAPVGHVRDAAMAITPYDGPIITAHCYAVSGRVLPRLVPFMQAILTRPPGHPDGGPMYNDGAINLFRAQNSDIVTLLLMPALAHQRSSRSDLAPNAWYDRAAGVRQITELARRTRSLLRGRGPGPGAAR